MPIRTTLALVRWWSARRRKKLISVGGILLYDRRRIQEPNSETVVKVVQAALAALTAAGSDIAVRDTIRGIVVVDGPAWIHYGFGLYEGPFDDLLVYPEPLAMRLLFTATMAQLFSNGIRSGKWVRFADRHVRAYEALEQFARRSVDPALAMRTAREYYAPPDKQLGLAN